MNQRSPQRQSIPRSLVRNEPTTSRARLCIQPSRAQLAHPRVDQRVAGAALAPGLERPLRVAPLDRAPVAVLELRAGVAREVVQDVVVEVAPAELAAKRLRATAAGQPLLDRPHRDAAEVQVRGQPRRVVPAERVVIVRVAADRAVEEAVEGLARRGLAAAGGIADLLLEPERLEGRQPPLGEPRTAGAAAREAPRARRGAAPRASGDGTGRRRCRACPAPVSIARTSTALRPWCERSSAPASRSARATRSPLRRAYGLTSWVT